MDPTTHIYAPIINKSFDDATGHLTVFGKLTGPGVDLDGQRVDPEWAREAVPNWMKVGNIREMHMPSAVGKALSAEERADGWYVSAKVVDKAAIEKVQEGIYTGFSIGIKSPVVAADPTGLAPKGLIKGGNIIESSLVDKPCLEDATFAEPAEKLVLAKAALPDVEIIAVPGVRPEEMLDKGLVRTEEMIVKGSPPAEGGHSHEHIHGDGTTHTHAHVHNPTPSIKQHDAADYPHEHTHEDDAAADDTGDDADDDAEDAGKSAQPDGRLIAVGDTETLAKLVREELDRREATAKAAEADIEKKAYSDEERAEMAKKGEAIPIKNAKGEITGGAYPIATAADLENAIHAVGRAAPGDQAAVKAHIIKRAKALGLSDKIPDSWKGAEPDLTKATTKPHAFEDKNDDGKCDTCDASEKGGMHLRNFKRNQGKGMLADLLKLAGPARSIVVDSALMTLAAKGKAVTLTKADDAAGPDDPTDHTASYEAAIKALSELIQQEAAEMAQGDDEWQCLARLLCAYKWLQAFLAGEQMEGELLDEGEPLPDPNLYVPTPYMGMAAKPDTTKGAEPEPKEPNVNDENTKTVLAEIAKLSKAVEPVQRIETLTGEMAELRKTIESQGETIKTQAERLEAIEKLPAATGPKRAVADPKLPAEATTKAKAEADYYLKLADQTGTSRVMAEGYRQLAAETLKAAGL